jgi:very-short-patch-repair endonuclease
MRLEQREFSKKLRQGQTDVERKMWSLLRSRRLAGYKFRRQQPIGPYVADFCCFRPRVIVELDGGQHAEQAEKDQRRTAFLESEGFRVIRFWDNQVLKEMYSVMEVILEAMKNGPLTPTLSHVGERGRSATKAQGD